MEREVISPQFYMQPYTCIYRRYYASVLVKARNFAATSHVNRRSYVPTEMYHSFAAFFTRKCRKRVCADVGSQIIVKSNKLGQLPQFL